MSEYYRYHIFFCGHQRPDKASCAQEQDVDALRHYAKQRVKALKLAKVRVNQAGCLNRCTQGPLLVIYPQGIWYRYQNQQDIDEIIEQHIVHGRIVSRLQL